MPQKQNDEPVRVPLRYPTSLIYMDESGTAGNGRVFVVGALKVRRHGELARALHAVRDATARAGEFRFNRINRTTAHTFTSFLEPLRSADVFFAATIIDRAVEDPTIGLPHWEAHAEIAGKLLRACINRRELVSISMDIVSTPPHVAIEDEIAYRVNRRLRNKSIITSAVLDSRSCNMLQLVDVLTSAVACDYRHQVGMQAKIGAHKKAVVARAKDVLGVEAFIGRGPRSNVMVWRKRETRKPAGHAKVVSIAKRQAG